MTDAQFFRQTLYAVYSARELGSDRERRSGSHIGNVATLTTSFYPPFIATRLATTFDHITTVPCGA